MNNKTPEEKIQSMIESGKYPDFIDGGDDTQTLKDANVLVPLEDYIDKYPNIKNYLSESDCKKITDNDGHIYTIPQFGVVKGEDKSTIHKGEAFWIQKEVLKWDNYPNIRTLDEYFDLIERYKKAHPIINGEKTVGFQILTHDWRMFCLENPPQFLAGYPNDGGAIVDPDTLEAKIYSDIPEAKIYFKKLNEAYNKGLIEADTFTISYNQYLNKLSTGAVLGMIDQYWQFESVDIQLLQSGFNNRRWVPLALTIDEDIMPNYYNYMVVNSSKGIGITKSCEDVDGAMKVINDLLDPEILILRNWGEKNIDYMIDENGEFYRTDEQRENSLDNKWILNNMCYYQYLPMYKGILEDGINAVVPWEQPREFYENLGTSDREILDSYGYETFNDFIPKVDYDVAPWYPIYSFSDNLSVDTPAGIAKQKMTEIKRNYLPRIIMSSIDDFEDNWDKYIYELRSNVNINEYEKALTNEVKRRVKEYSD
ncbi:extracellular solute-binding protein [Clostridium saudiense]|uniref:extracellular solute-binding protein n=1 Tax=Clostridium saudiense TaxID=1414720 RepID=UPI0018AC610C|nr:extracellular solute-binding protein [Clostridium saudiense]